MNDLTRRELVTLLGVTAAAAACGGRPGGKSGAGARQADSTGSMMKAPQFFTPHEFATVTLLANLVIPADERSGGASEAGVPAYIDFALREVEEETMRLAMRGGLAWLDAESGKRFGRTFVDATPAQRIAILDDIAWPAKTPPRSRTGPRSSATSAISSPPRSGRAAWAWRICGTRAMWLCRSGPAALRRRSRSWV